MVSELMLQQTTVAAVVPLYERWMALFPTVAALAQATVDEVMAAWSGLGYYSRARRLHQTAQILLAAPDEPRTLGELLALPGLGPYTAAAVASIALGLPHLALDTNALRVLLRLYGWETRADSIAVQNELRRRVETALPDSDFGITNQALMELGASLCKVRAPACLLCPWNKSCQAHARGVEESIPLPKPKKAPRLTPVKAYLIGDLEDGCILVRGTSVGLLSDLYQPPLAFGQGLASGDVWAALEEWLNQQPPRSSGSAARLAYSISGRKLDIELEACDTPVATALDFLRSLGIEAALWNPTSNLALSSLTRKILKGWKESREALPSRDSTFPEF